MSVTAAGNRWHEGRVPVSEAYGEYGEGWTWFPTGKASHFQADWPVRETGWYSLRVSTTKGRTLVSDAMRFDADKPVSHELSIAHLRGHSWV